MEKKEDFSERLKVFEDFDFGRYREVKNERRCWERKEKRGEKIEGNRRVIENFFDRVREESVEKKKVLEMLNGVEDGEEGIDYEGFLLIMRHLVGDGCEDIREICVFLLALYSDNGRVPYDYLSSLDINGCFYRVLESFGYTEEIVGWYLTAIGNFFFSYQELVLKAESSEFLFKIIEFSEDCSDFFLDKCYFVVASIVYWDKGQSLEGIRLFLLEGLGLSCLSYETTERLLLSVYKKSSEFVFVNSHIDQLVKLVVSEISELDSLALGIVIDVLNSSIIDQVLDFGVLERLKLGLKGKFKKELLGIYLNLMWSSQVFISWLLEFFPSCGILDFLLVESEDIVLRVLVFIIKCVEIRRLSEIVVELGLISGACILLGGKKVDVIDKCLDLLFLLRSSELWQGELMKYQGHIILEELIFHKNSVISQKSEILVNMLTSNNYN